MPVEPTLWKNRSPGDLEIEFAEISAGDVETMVARSTRAFTHWRSLSLGQRWSALQGCRRCIEDRADELSRLIASETGKPLREAVMELGAVVAKFEFSFADAERFLHDEMVTDGPHPAGIRHRPRGAAAVIAPFNFPIHLGHGAVLAYLLAGNTVLFKPSPHAANVAVAYAGEMQAALPADVFQLVQGWGETGRALALHRDVRSVCFTGSIPAGTALARDLAPDYSKSLALELGGKNTVMICDDADLDAAAPAVADGLCFTTGQRCNATSRVLVHESIAGEFLERLRASLARYVPGDPLDPETTLGPLISNSSQNRYAELVALPVGDWLLPGSCVESVSGKRGHYVHPAVVLADKGIDSTSLAQSETFAPILVVETFSDEAAAVLRHEAWNFGLTASVFTRNEQTFQRLGDRLSVGNLYWNLPTTFSPSTLPFGGWGASGNGHPGGRGFIRFAVEEQAVQWKT